MYATLAMHDTELAAPYALTQAQLRQFREQGFIKLKQVFSPELLADYGQLITDYVLENNPQRGVPMEARNTYQQAFIQVMNLWTKTPALRAFSFSKRLARLAAELMGVSGVRLYHDQALYKEPSGGFTPWHADQFYWPVETSNTVTAWIPLQATPVEMGALAFATGSHRHDFGRDLNISDESEQRIRAFVKESGFEDHCTPFEWGEISFHYGWTLHHAGPNASTAPRKVMTVIYMDAEARLKQPSNNAQAQDWKSWCPGAQVGEIIATPLNPILWP